MMRLTRLSLGNWRNFKSVNVALAPRTFIVGPNAIGKSNLLDALRFLRDLSVSGGGLAKAIEDRGGIVRVRSLHATRNSNVTVGVDARAEDGSCWRYELQFNAVSGIPEVISEKALEVQPDGTEVVRLERPDQLDLSDRERLTETAVQQTSANHSFRSLVEFFRTFSYMHLVPQLVREESMQRASAAIDDPFGRDLMDRIRSTQSRSRGARLRRIADILIKVVPQFESLSFSDEDPKHPHLIAQFKHWRRNKANQNELQFSDGTLRLIGLLWSLQESGGPLLLEEPELSLHTAIVRQLAPFIARSRRDGRQVILSTHSEHLLADPGIAAGEIVLVVPEAHGNGSSVIYGGDDLDIKRLMNAGLVASEVVLPITNTTIELTALSA